MLFQDRREIELNGKKLTIRQRSLSDIVALERGAKAYQNNTTGQAVVLACKVRDALKYDNGRSKITIINKLFPISIKWVLKHFSIAELSKVSKEIDDLETYQEKKTATESV